MVLNFKSAKMKRIHLASTIKNLNFFKYIASAHLS